MKRRLRLLSLDGFDRTQALVSLCALVELEAHHKRPTVQLFDLVAGVGSSIWVAAALGCPDDGDRVSSAESLVDFLATNWDRWREPEVIHDFFRGRTLRHAKIETLLFGLDMAEGKSRCFCSWRARYASKGTAQKEDQALRDLLPQLINRGSSRDTEPEPPFQSAADVLVNPTQAALRFLNNEFSSRDLEGDKGPERIEIYSFAPRIEIEGRERSSAFNRSLSLARQTHEAIQTGVEAAHNTQSYQRWDPLFRLEKQHDFPLTLRARTFFAMRETIAKEVTRSPLKNLEDD